MTAAATYAQRIDNVLDAARKQIEAIAEAYRQDVLIPLCRKRKLTFKSGNGVYCFYREDGESVGARWECEHHHMPWLEPVFETLDTRVFGTNDCLGFYVGDVELTARVDRTAEREVDEARVLSGGEGGMHDAAHIRAANEYVSRTRNKAKKTYARKYLDWMLGVSSGCEPVRGAVSVMGAQAVRIALRELLPAGKP